MDDITIEQARAENRFLKEPDEDERESQCGTLDCPDICMRYGCYCGDCYEMRSKHYQELVAGTGYIKIVKHEDGRIERLVIKKQ